MAGILNLGYIQDGLRAEDFSAQDIEIMWGAMLQNIDPQNLELSKIVATSITNLAPTAVTHFGEEQKRQGIMQGLFELLGMQDPVIRSRTLEALITIVSQNYRYMGPFLEQFYQMTESFIQQDDDDGKIAQSSVEVWSSLFEEELAEQASMVPEKAEIIQKYQWQKVADLFLRGLQRTGLDADQEVDGDDQEQSVSLACQMALNLLAQVVKDNILESTFGYFTQLREHEEGSPGQG